MPIPALLLCAAAVAVPPSVLNQDPEPSAPVVATESSGSTEAPQDEGGTWPQWRGPARDGTYSGPAWPKSLDEEHLSLRWKVEELGESYASPIVSETMVFTVESKDGLEVVRAFAREDGKELWRTEWEDAMKVPFFAARNGSWVRSTPAWDGARLYVGGMLDRLVCLEGETGDVVWEVDFKQRYRAPKPNFGFVCSPLILGDHLYVQAGAGFCKLERATGKSVWRTLIDENAMMGSAFSSPVLATVGGREQLLVLTRAEMCGVDHETGEALWQRPIKSFRGMNILTPMVHGERVFTAPYGGRAQLLDIRADEQGSWSTEQVWTSRAQGYMSSPVFHEGHAYLFTKAGRFACIRLDDGENLWTSGPTGDEYYSLVRQGDRILALSNTGVLKILSASPEAYVVEAERQIADNSWAHLAVVPGGLFVRDLGFLAAYDWR